jgi:hypothetical protein
MAYIGASPPASALTASDISDGIISNAKLAQDIISADTALGATPADTDEFLVSDAGTLKRMDYSHIKAGGAWNLVSAQTASNVAQIEFTDSHFTSTYDVYKLVISNAIPATNAQAIRMRVSQGDAYNTGTNYRWGVDYLWDNDQARYGATSDNEFEVTYIQTGSATGETFNMEMTIYTPLATNNFKLFEATTVFVNEDASSPFRSDFFGMFKTGEDTALDAFKIYMASGNITSGLFVLYGLSKS